MRAQIDQLLPSIWQHRGLLAWLLAPLSALYSALLRLRTGAYAIGLARSHRLPVPVIVIGNLYLGGTGKTPLTIELVRALAAAGRRPGVVSRGYGRGGDEVRCVGPDDDPQTSGDEPLLIVRATSAPLAIGRRRMAAARALLREHPDCDCIVSDDGLQHLAMARDVEIAVIDARGLGNGWVLPAGPLREPARRLASVDAIVAHKETPGRSQVSLTPFGGLTRSGRFGGSHDAGGAVPSWVTAPCFSMRSKLGTPWQLARPTLRRELGQFGSTQRTDGLRITAAAGIGVPARFFAMLRAAGLTIEELPLPDHYDFRADPFASVAADCILITEKDAVKCSADERLRRDERIWVAPLAADIDPELIEFVLARLRQAQKEKLRGPAPA